MKKVLAVALIITSTYLLASGGADLTKSCIACHGANFTTPPLGREHHIVRDSRARIVKWLKYYKHPKEDDEMVMQKQVKNLTNAQINEIADYIIKGTPASDTKAVNITKSCVACHGAHFTKAPLGREHHIVRDSRARIVKWLKYYKHPKEDDEMVMQKQVKNLTDAQINEIADYIMHLKK